MREEFCVWKAVDRNGKLCRGTWSIAEVSMVRSLLFKQGYYPLSIRLRRRISFAVLHSDFRGVWSSFLRKLAVLLDAGIPLLAALDILVLQERRSVVKQKWRKLRDKVAAGNDLSEAIMLINPAPPVFARVMIKAGERSGDLARTLESLVNELDQEQQFKHQIEASLTYPLMLLLAAVGVLYLLGSWVLPIYEKMFADLGADLPALTRALFTLGHGVPLLLQWFSGITAVALIALRFRYGVDWRGKLEQWSLILPVLGRILRLKEIQRFSSVMGMLLKAGIVFDDSLKLTEELAVSAEMKKLTGDLSGGIRQGKNLAPVFRANTSFPVVAREMLGIAEETGQWDKMFLYLAGMFKGELEELTEKTARFIEPVTITLIAGFIGLTAVGVLLPVFDAGTHLQ